MYKMCLSKKLKSITVIFIRYFNECNNIVTNLPKKKKKNCSLFVISNIIWSILGKYSKILTIIFSKSRHEKDYYFFSFIC